MAYRVAPSPTGTVHIGTIRTAYFNYLLAKCNNMPFYLRIDDTDNNRSLKEHEDLLFKCLDWVGIDYKFAFRQSERISRYREVSELLLKNGFATKDGDAIRLTPSKEYLDGLTSWYDEISGENKISADDKSFINGMVIMKSDGTPVYHYASCVDDFDMNIYEINRGADHKSNVPKQLAIWDHLSIVLGKTYKPKFSHVGLIFANKKKMSKRDSGSSMQHYIDNNYAPEAILNAVIRLGWSPSDAEYDKKNPLIPKEVAEKIFTTAGKMKASPANFDMAKLEWYNKKYTQQK